MKARQLRFDCPKHGIQTGKPILGNAVLRLSCGCKFVAVTGIGWLPDSEPAAAMQDKVFNLPTVAGRRLRGSNDDFERSCLVHIERLQNGLGEYDSAMLDTFCEAVRLVREYSDVMNEQIST